MAKEYRVNIIAGSVANCRDEKIYNTAAVFNRDGEVVMEYDKVHLFSPSGEHEYFEHGKNICNFELDGIPCSLVICYDIRFPELIRSEMLAGSKVQFVVAQWPDTRLLHWDTLNRARAIESQSFYAVLIRSERLEIQSAVDILPSMDRWESAWCWAEKRNRY